MEVLILENTERGLEDLNEFLKDNIKIPVKVYTDPEKMLNHTSQGNNLFIIDMLTPGLTEKVMKEIFSKQKSSVIALTNKSNDELVKQKYGNLLYRQILKHPGMAEELLKDFEVLKVHNGA
jgi:DNA-binding response OmpR family regulator